MGFILETSLVISSAIIRQDYVWETEAVGSDSGAESGCAPCPPGGTAAPVSEASLLELSVKAADANAAMMVPIGTPAHPGPEVSRKSWWWPLFFLPRSRAVL